MADVHPSIKCLIKMPDGVCEGNTIIIKGSIPSNAIRFSINLQCGPSISMTDREDIAFHLNPRFNNNTVALNHLVDNEWGLEESFGGMPFSEGTFELEIVCDESAFKSVKCMLKMPNGVYEGNTIIIKGSIPSYATRFGVNLQCGSGISISDTNRDDIAFHFNPRFYNNTVVLNYLENNHWGLPKDFWSMPFSKGTFELEIECDESAFKVNVQGKRFCEFAHRVPYTRVKALTVDGDVNVTTYELLPKKKEVDMSEAPQVQDPEESIPTTVKNNV
nr:32 kDa beta-galactoside-binding lectin isoform X3 [Helicoverpa armigera]